MSVQDAFDLGRELARYLLGAAPSRGGDDLAAGVAPAGETLAALNRQMAKTVAAAHPHPEAESRHG